MNEATPLKDFLNEFNKIIMDLNNIDEKIKDENQAIIWIFRYPRGTCNVGLTYDRDIDTSSNVSFCGF